MPFRTRQSNNQQGYAVFIDSYGGYILESFATHSVKKQRNAKGKEVQKKKKKPHQKKKDSEKKKGEKKIQKCLRPV